MGLAQENDIGLSILLIGLLTSGSTVLSCVYRREAMELPATREDDMMTNADYAAAARTIIADARACAGVHRVSSVSHEALAIAVAREAGDADFAFGLPDYAVEVYSLDPNDNWRVIITPA
jgi:hypothetical protein